MFKRLILLALAVAFSFSLFCMASNDTAPFWNPKQTPYPQFKKSNKTWSYRSESKHGNVTVADPYYLLEKPIGKDAIVDKFIDDQMNLTERYIDQCKSKTSIETSIKNAFDYDNYNNMQLVNATKPFYLYSLKKGEGQNKQIWYTASIDELEKAKKDNLAIPPGKKFLDENFLSKNGTLGIASVFPSPDGQYLAYLVTDGGDLTTGFIRRFDSPLVQAETFPPGGEGALTDSITFIPGDNNIIWTKDNCSFFYVQENDNQVGANPNVDSTVKYHKIGTKNENDIIVVHPEQPDKDGNQNYWFLSSSLDSNWLVLTGLIDTSGKSKVYASLLTDQTISDSMKWISIAPQYKYWLQLIDIVEDIFYAQTNFDAPDGKAVKIQLDWNKARSVKKLSELEDQLPLIDVIAETKGNRVTSSYLFNHDKLMITGANNGRYIAKLYNLLTGEFLLDVLPNETGSLYGVTNSIDSVILHYSGTVSPRTIYEIGYKDGKYYESLITRQAIKGSKPEDFITESFFATSKDGTKIPYSIVHKNRKKDGTAPCIMHAYGAYGTIGRDYWDVGFYSWLLSYNGFLVWLSIRGGGDLGEEWHIAGQGKNKQNTFDDIIAIAKDLVQRKICAPGLLIGDGGSAGGLAVAAVANQAPPGLFGAILPRRAVCDEFEDQRNYLGSTQKSEFGDVNDPSDFDSIIKWSPYQNVNQNQHYPAILLQAGGVDDRVTASQSFKFLARLQHNNPDNPMPMLLYLAKSSGHLGSATNAYITEYTYQHCFLELALGLKNTF